MAVCCSFCLVTCGQKSVAFTKDVAGIDVSHHQGKVEVELDRDLEDAPPDCILCVSDSRKWSVALHRLQFTEYVRIEGIENWLISAASTPIKA